MRGALRSCSPLGRFFAAFAEPALIGDHLPDEQRVRMGAILLPAFARLLCADDQAAAKEKPIAPGLDPILQDGDFCTCRRLLRLRRRSRRVATSVVVWRLFWSFRD